MAAHATQLMYLSNNTHRGLVAGRKEAGDVGRGTAIWQDSWGSEHHRYLHSKFSLDCEVSLVF